MKRSRLPERLARPAATGTVALVAAMMTSSFASLVLPGTELIPERPTLVDFLAVSAIVVAFPLVGSVVVVRRPRNGVGWLFLVIGLLMANATFTTEYVDRHVYTGLDLPAVGVAAWMSAWAWAIAPMFALPLAVVLFPEGRLPSGRWRVAVVGTLVMPVVATVSLALAPGPLLDPEQYPEAAHITNPIGVPGPVGAVLRAVAVSDVVALLSFVPPTLVALAYTIRRVRRAHGPERQQLKWLLYPVAVLVVTIALAIVTEAPVAWHLALGSIAAVPIAAGIAILRYQLYDIDVVIRRTLVYAGVVAVLAAVYVSLVLVLQAPLSMLTGGETLPVALSTLATAALFGPVRARVRAVVDRRFYRSHYDAQRTIAVFAGRLRGEMELDAVGRALVETAVRSVRPAGAGLWVRRPR